MNLHFHQEKIITSIFALIFLVAPFYYQPNIGGSGLNLPANVVIWFSVILLVCVTGFSLCNISRLYYPKKFLFILAFPICATISGFVTGVTQPTEWLFRFIYIWFGILFFLSLYQVIASERIRNNLLLIISISGLIHALVAIVQIYQPPGIVIWLPTAPRPMYPVGMFQQINNQASFQATVLLINWYLFTNESKTDNWWVSSVLLISTLFSAFILIAAGSRVGLLGAFLGLLLFLWLKRGQLIKVKNQTFLMLVVMLLGGAFALNTGGLAYAVKKANNQTEYSSEARLGIYTIAGELIKNKPLFGYGIGSFTSVWQYQKANYQERNPNINLIDQYVTHPHNELIFWQVEGGLLASLGMIISGILLLYITYIDEVRRFILALIIPISLHMMVELPFYTSVLHWILFLTLLAIGVGNNRQEKHFRLSSPMMLTLRTTTVVTVVFSLLFSFFTLRAGTILNLATKGKEVDLSLALKNPYFSDTAEDFYMQKIFVMANENHSIDLLQQYVNWAEVFVKSNPNELHIKFLIAAYQTLNLPTKACNLARTAHFMYKNNEEFSNFYSHCK